MTLWIILLILAVAMGGIGMAIAGMTLASPWIGAGIGLLLATMTFPAFLPVWRKITANGKIWVCAICQAAMIGSLGFMLTFGLNYWLADDSSLQTVDAHVIAKFQQEHRKTRRAGRRYVPTGEVWHSYHVTLELPDGRRKNREVKVSEYISLRTGSKMRIGVEKGLFGMDIVKPVNKSRNRSYRSPK